MSKALHIEESTEVLVARRSLKDDDNALPFVQEWSDQSATATNQTTTKAGRIRALQNDFVIAYPTYAQGINYALCMVKQGRRPRAPGFIITRPPASGKTTFGRTMIRKFQQLPPSWAVENQPPCAVMISLTGLTTSHGFWGRILRAVNGPYRDRQLRSEREDAAIGALMRANCGLLIFDELQDILTGRPSERQRVLDTIKYAMNTLCTPILALGTEDAGRAFDGDPHLRARFSEMKLSVWRFGKPYLNLLAGVERHLNLRGESTLTEKAIAMRILELSGGQIGAIMDIVRHAAIEAIATGSETITEDMLRPIAQFPNHHFFDEDFGSES